MRTRKRPTETDARPRGSWLLRLLGVLLMLTAVAVALSRAPDRPVQSLVAQWAPPPSDFVEIRGQLVHLRDVGPRGDPEPVLLLHGTSASLHTWEGWVKALQVRRRVVTLDLPGFGLTGPFTGAYARPGADPQDPAPPADYSGDAYARFVIDILDALKIERAVLGGNSLGGEIAWRVATLAPQRVASLVLVDAVGPPFEPSPTAVPLGWVVARTPGLSWLSEWLLPRALVAQGLAGSYADPTRITAQQVDRYFELTLRDGNRRALGQRLRQMKIGEGAERIAAIRQPTLILWGAEDRLVPLAVGREFERRIPGSRLVVLDGLGHVPQEEDPARSVAPVLAFLGLAAPAAGATAPAAAAAVGVAASAPR